MSTMAHTKKKQNTIVEYKITHSHEQDGFRNVQIIIKKTK